MRSDKTIRRSRKPYSVGDIVGGVKGVFIPYDEAEFYLEITEMRKMTVVEAYNEGLMNRTCVKIN